jgi:hypothetical protein
MTTGAAPEGVAARHANMSNENISFPDRMLKDNVTLAARMAALYDTTV